MAMDMKCVMPPGVTTSVLGTPIADAFAATCVTDVVLMENFREAYFFLILGDETGGTATPTITAIPSSTAAKTATTTAIYFEYMRVSATETQTEWVRAATLTCTAGDNQLYVICVKAEDLPDGYPYVYLAIAETVNDPVLGGCVIMLTKPRYASPAAEAVTA